MLIQSWDAARDPFEWRRWLDSTERFGTLVVNNIDPAHAPPVVPTHFTLSDDELLLHLARNNPIWPHLEAAAEVRLAIAGDYAYIPGYWRAHPDQPAEHGVPTSYYAAVQFRCRPEILDDPDGKAEILSAQLHDLQPEGRHAPVSSDDSPYARMLAGIRGLRLHVLEVDAKFKYDDQKLVEHRERVSNELEQRNQRLGTRAAAQQRRRLADSGPSNPEQAQ